MTLLKSWLFYYRCRALQYYVKVVNLRSKHRPRFYNIKEPFLSKNYTTLYDAFEISIILLPLPRSAVLCQGLDTNFLLYKHRFRFYNIKEPANSLAPCWLWQYGLWNFQTGYMKLERFLPKNQYTQWELAKIRVFKVDYRTRAPL